MSEIISQFTVPLRINKNKVKVKMWSLNLNNLIQVSKFPAARNALKQKYAETIKDSVSKLWPIKCEVKCIFVIYAGNKRIFDISNVGAVIDKFTLDSLVSAGVLEDDNINFVPRVEYIYAEVDKENPRCEVFIVRNDKEEYKKYLKNSV